jgi:hypothetical protein
MKSSTIFRIHRRPLASRQSTLLHKERQKERKLCWRYRVCTIVRMMRSLSNTCSLRVTTTLPVRRATIQFLHKTFHDIVQAHIIFEDVLLYCMPLYGCASFAVFSQSLSPSRSCMVRRRRLDRARSAAINAQVQPRGTLQLRNKQSLSGNTPPEEYEHSSNRSNGGREAPWHWNWQFQDRRGNCK